MIDFPASPTNGQIIVLGDNKYIWNSTTSQWKNYNVLDSFSNAVTFNSTTTFSGTPTFSTTSSFGDVATFYNNIVMSGTGSLTLPIGTTAQRPSTPTTGQVRFNTTSTKLETSIYGFWIQDNNSHTEIIGKTRVVFEYTGANQSWVVPAGITHIFVKMWGAGGGGGSYGGWRQGSTGGAGGYSEAIVPVVAGQTLTLQVGGRGWPRWGANRAWPNGGGASTGGGDNQYSASGGASSCLIVPTINSGSPCMFAGGGGGGGCVTGWARLPGGAGGGLQGEDGHADIQGYEAWAYTGKRGTQTSGGAAPSGANTVGGAGSYNQGGTHQHTSCYGGGGGGGFYGGSSGCYNGSGMTGGGGGSGFIYSSLIRARTLTGIREYPPMFSDPDLVEYSGSSTRCAIGGDEAAAGGNGLIVIYY